MGRDARRRVGFYAIAEGQVVVEIAAGDVQPDVFGPEVVVAAPMEKFRSFAGGLRNGLFFSFDAKVVAAGIAGCVCQQVGEVIGTGFVYAEGAPAGGFDKP